MRNLKPLLLCTLVGWTANALASSYYVALNGSNSNPGTINQPWRTISYAVSTSSGVSAGDTIYVREGRFLESIIPQISGTASSPIFLRNLPGESVTVDSGRILLEDGINYWKMRGFTCKNSSNSGLRVTGTHEMGCLEVDSCIISYHKYNGVELGGPDFGGVAIYDCIIEYNGEWGGEPFALEEGSGIVMYGNKGKLWARRDTIRYNWTKGISHGSDGTWDSDSSVVDSCYIWDNFEAGMCWAACNSYIRYNYFAWNGTRDAEAGEWGDTGLNLTRDAMGNMVVFNVVRSSGRYELEPSGANNMYYNNTVIKDHVYDIFPGSTDAATIILWASIGSGNEFRNNIFINLVSEPMHHFVIHSGGTTPYTSQTWSNNLYWAPNATSPYPYSDPFRIGGYLTLEELQAAYPDQEIGSIYEDPLFVSYPDSNFILSENSPARNAGINVGFSYSGTAPDLGAFEYDEGNTPPWIDPPIFDFITEEDVVFSYDLTPHENDPEQTGEELTWSLSGLDPALASGSVDPVTDLLTINPVPDQHGSDDIMLFLSDGQGGFDSQRVTLIVNPVNDPPWILPAVPNSQMYEDIPFALDLTPYENDIEDSAAAIYWSVSEANPQLISASVNLPTDEMSIIPVPDAHGSDTLLLTLHDSGGLTDSQDWILTVEAVNDTPWIAPPIPDQVIEDYEPFTVSLLGHGHDVEDPPEDLTWEIFDVDSTLFSASIDPVSKVLTMIPVPGATGSDEILLTVSDVVGAGADQVVFFHLMGTGAPPVGPEIASLPDFYLPIGFMPEPLDLRPYVTCGTDPFEMLIFFTTVWDPQGVGTPDLITSVKAGILYIETPTPDWEGTRLVAVRALDSHGLSSEDTMQVTFSELQVGQNLPEPDSPESWQIADSSQVVHADSFLVHLTGVTVPLGFASFQITGGEYTTWRDAPGIEVFCFPLIPDTENLLELRIRYENGQFGPTKGLIITEDSTPPQAPEGLSVRPEEGGEPSGKISGE